MLDKFLNLFRKEPTVLIPDYSSVEVDFHSHLIPGIDDGSKTLQESVELIRQLHALGFKKIITSPHVMPGGYNNTPEIILGGRDKVREALKANNIEVGFDAAAEYYLDELFDAKIESGELLTMGDKYVLLELSYMTLPRQMMNTFFKLKSAGYKTILAHPERYPFFYEKSLAQYRDIKQKGVYFQLNISSLTGVYGAGAKTTAEQLIDEGMIDFISTDLHNQKHLDHIHHALTMPYLEKVLTSGRLMNKVFL